MIAIISILVSIAIPAYENYQDERDFLQARQDILLIQKAIDRYYVLHNKFPNTLADVNMLELKDPWGTTYYYLNVSTFNKKVSDDKVRRDRKLKPVNSDYDLFSAGKDSQTRPPFSAKVSRDDVVRCNNGQYLGYAKDY